jgi:hypothetical protein
MQNLLAFNEEHLLKLWFALDQCKGFVEFLSISINVFNTFHEHLVHRASNAVSLINVKLI